MNDRIRSHQFDNGLVLLAEPMDWLESAAFTILVPGGSAHDPAERAGLAGFTCEMALRGCGSRKNRQFVTELDNLGVDRSQAISDVHTSYVGATLAANLPQALRIYADLLRRAHLPEEEFDAGRRVMLHELHAVLDDLQHRLIIELRRRHLREPWGRPGQGNEAGIAATSPSDVKRFYQAHYRPNDCVLAVAGAVDFHQLVELTGELLGDWEPAPSEPLEESGHSTKTAHLHEDSTQTHIGIAYPTVPFSHPDYPKAWAVLSALSGGMSSRLFMEVRERRGLCYSVYASFYPLRDRASVLAYAGTTADRAQETLDVMLAELKGITTGLEPNELDRVKARGKSGLVMQQESSFARSLSIARDWYFLGEPRTLEEIKAQVDALTLAGINDFLAAHCPDDFTIVTLGPEPLEVPVGIS